MADKVTIRQYTTKTGHTLSFANRVPGTWAIDTINASMIYWTTSEQERTGGLFGPKSLMFKAHNRLDKESEEGKQLIVLGTIKLFVHQAVLAGYVMINKDILPWGLEQVKEACKLANIPVPKDKKLLLSNIVLNHLLKDMADLWAVVGIIMDLAGDDLGKSILGALSPTVEQQPSVA